MIKLLHTCLFLLMTFVGVSSQDKKSRRISPPKVFTTIIDHKLVEISYGSPSVKDREIWGQLVPFGEIWRTGANEATTLECSHYMRVQGKAVAPGKYALFTIPGEEFWVIILNANWDQWGTYRYKEAEDVLRIEVYPKRTEIFAEELIFEKTGDHTISLLWANLEVPIEID